jgi:hypothetical protein
MVNTFEQNGQNFKTKWSKLSNKMVKTFEQNGQKISNNLFKTLEQNGQKLKKKDFFERV